MPEHQNKTELPENDLKESKRGTLLAMAALYEVAAEDGSQKQRILSALESLCLCAIDLKSVVPRKLDHPEGDLPDNFPVTIPYWIIRELVTGWLTYKSAPAGKTLGECFGLEGGGQGKRPAKQKWEQQTRDLVAAVQVAILVHAAHEDGDHLSLEQAFAEIAETFDVSTDTIKRAWETYGYRVLRNPEVNPCLVE